jgi:hypothetical protein
MGAAARSFVEREHDLTRIGETFAEIVGCPRPLAAAAGSGPGR